MFDAWSQLSPVINRSAASPCENSSIIHILKSRASNFRWEYELANDCNKTIFIRQDYLQTSTRIDYIFFIIRGVFQNTWMSTKRIWVYSGNLRRIINSILPSSFIKSIEGKLHVSFALSKLLYSNLIPSLAIFLCRGTSLYCFSNLSQISYLSCLLSAILNESFNSNSFNQNGLCSDIYKILWDVLICKNLITLTKRSIAPTLIAFTKPIIHQNVSSVYALLIIVNVWCFPIN